MPHILHISDNWKRKTQYVMLIYFGGQGPLLSILQTDQVWSHHKASFHVKDHPTVILQNLGLRVLYESQALLHMVEDGDPWLPKHLSWHHCSPQAMGMNEWLSSLTIKMNALGWHGGFMDSTVTLEQESPWFACLWCLQVLNGFSTATPASTIVEKHICLCLLQL